MFKRPERVWRARAIGFDRRFWSTIVILGTVLCGITEPALAQRRPAEPVATRLAKSNTPMKGIWEPVSYNQDIALESVYFVTPRVGWASGKNGTIIKTVDAGAHWTAQLGGDRQNDSKSVTDLRFVDQRHGFAVQQVGYGDATLLRTVDGQTWRASGTVPQIRGDYVFTSPSVGFVTTRNEIRRTRDAGRSWQKVLDCAANVNVDGLSRNMTCTIESLSFPTPQIGYGFGKSTNARANGTTKGIFFAKTTDGGNTWSIWRVLDDEDAHQGFAAFTDPSNGILCTFEGRMYATSDAGKSWDGIPGIDCSGGIAAGRFADPETGWVLANRHWSYTSDGGQHWGTRSLAWPADAYAFSLPRRDRGYVVGDHGMVYRYSVVPAEHTAANAIDAPVVGAFTSPLDDQVEEFVADAGEFSSENGGPSFGGGSAGGGSASGSASASASGSASDPNSGGAFDPGSGSTGSTGSTGATGRKAKGGNTLGKLQAILDVIGASVPDFNSRYRNLNLLFEGARTAAGMSTWLQNVKSSLAAFRASTDKASAAAALAQLLNATDSLKTNTDVAFQQSTFTPGPDDSASGFTFTPANAAVDSTRSGVQSAAVDSAKKAAKDAVKKGLGGLFNLGKKH